MNNLTAEQIAGIKACPFCGAKMIEVETFRTKKTATFVHPEEPNGCPGRAVNIIVGGDNSNVSAWNRRASAPLPEGYALVPIEPTEATASEPAIDALREVDVSVLTAARDMNDDDKRQPAWIWHHHDKPGVNYGRWPRIEGAVPYIRADLVLSSIRNTGPAAASPAIPTARDGGDEAIAALKALDDYWTEDFPGGPEGSRVALGGLGTVNEEVFAIWRKVRAALSNGAQP